MAKIGLVNHQEPFLTLEDVSDSRDEDRELQIFPMCTQWTYLSFKKRFESIVSSIFASGSLRMTTGNQTLFILYLFFIYLFECDYRVHPDLAELEMGLGLSMFNDLEPVIGLVKTI